MGVTELDFDALCRPYEKRPIASAPPMTPAIQRQWLMVDKKLPADIVDLAMVGVYSQIAAGKTYPDGERLAMDLFATAKQLERRGHEATLREFQSVYRDALKTFGRAGRGRKKPASILRHPLMALRWYRAFVFGFVFGLAIGGGSWLSISYLL